MFRGLNTTRSHEKTYGCLTLGGIANKSLSLREGDIGWGSTVTLVVGNDLHTIVLPNTNAGIGGTKIDTNGFSSNCGRKTQNTRMRE